MRITPDEYRRRFPDRPEPIGIQLHGKWIAWDSSVTRILAHADTLDDLDRELERQGFSDVVYQKVPRGAFVGVGYR